MELLRRLRRAARPVDVSLVVLALALLVLAVEDTERGVRYACALTAVALVVELGRHRRPVPCLLVAFVLVGVALHLAQQAPVLLFLATLVLFGVAGAAPRRPVALVGGGAGAVSVGQAMLTNPYTQGWSDLTLTLAFCGIVWAAGLLAAERGRQASRSHEQVLALRRSRDADLAAAAERERVRIAGDLHDVVSHGLSLVIVQTVAARADLADLGADAGGTLDRRLGIVEETAREGLADMRRLLGLLRPAGDDVPPERAGLAEVPELVRRTREAGHRVDLQLRLAESGPPLPAGLEQAGYRIVQEALTNVVRHAPGSAASVLVHGDAARLHIRVCNTNGHPGPRGGGAGYGLQGMRRRVALYGGTLEAGATPDGYAVEATFALEAAR